MEIIVAAEGPARAAARRHSIHAEYLTGSDTLRDLRRVTGSRDASGHHRGGDGRLMSGADLADDLTAGLTPARSRSGHGGRSQVSSRSRHLSSVAHSIRTVH